MIAKYAVDDPTDILLFIIDADLDLIASGDHRVDKKRLRELSLEIELKDIDRLLQLGPIVSIESDGRSRSLSFWFFPFESIFDHIL